ncbi:MAG: hypothetical protein KDH20_20975 [Rhodocyclaceae bacterium]|nr:hypothetical protein [Rhodocyclaceae bacterium]
MTHSALRFPVTALLLAAGLALAAPASAASACKGMEKGRCGGNASCTWVDSYTTKKGNKVDGYCRSKGGKKSTSATSSKRSSDSSKSTKRSSTTKTSSK